MALEDLPPQAPLRLPEGQAYGERVLARSRSALSSHPSLLDQAFGPDYYQKLDVFFPERPPAGGAPILVFAHGGSWIAGYKEWMAFMAPAVTALPAVFVSVSYRLAPGAKHPAPYEDCLAAIAWVHDNARSLRGDRSRLYVGGHSAGAHLMALAATRPDDLSSRGLPPDVIKGCAAVSGAFDLRLSDPPEPVQSHAHQVLLADPAQAEAASPIANVSPATRPFLITVGETDFPDLREQAVRMADRLRAAAVPVVFQDLPGHDHFATNERSVEAGHPWLTELARMIGTPAR